MSPPILVEGWLFRILSTSHNKVVNKSVVMVLLFVIDSNERFIDFMSDSHLLRGGLVSIWFSIRKFWTLFWSKMSVCHCFNEIFTVSWFHYTKKTERMFLTLFRMDLFGAAHGWGVKKSPLPKNCRTYPTKMKLGAVIPYLKNTQKIHKSRDTPHEFCWHQHFLTGNQ